MIRQRMERLVSSYKAKKSTQGAVENVVEAVCTGGGLTLFRIELSEIK